MSEKTKNLVAYEIGEFKYQLLKKQYTKAITEEFIDDFFYDLMTLIQKENESMPMLLKDLESAQERADEARSAAEECSCEIMIIMDKLKKEMTA